VAVIVVLRGGGGGDGCGGGGSSQGRIQEFARGASPPLPPSLIRSTVTASVRHPKGGGAGSAPL